MLRLLWRRNRSFLVIYSLKSLMLSRYDMIFFMMSIFYDLLWRKLNDSEYVTGESNYSSFDRIFTRLFASPGLRVVSLGRRTILAIL